MLKLNLKKDLKHLYNPPSKEVVVVDVPCMNFLMLDGSGDPNTAPAYQQAVEALYSVAFTLKFIIKKSEAIDYPVMPLEGLWWVDDLAQLNFEHRDNWRWTMMIMQPDCVTPTLVSQALDQVREKKALPAVAKLRLESLHEGLAAQTLYVGPYAAELPTVARVHEFILGSGRRLTGKHHEIYLGDPRRTAPEKLKTVIRQPMAK